MKRINDLPALPVAAAILVIGLIFASFVYDPVQKVENDVGEPAARAVGALSAQCPGGWSATNARGEHVRVESCSKGGWTVFLNEDNSLSHACPTTNGICSGALVYPNNGTIAVPGWK